MMVQRIIRILIPALLLIFQYYGSYGQRFIARNGYVRFYSEAPLENIEAVNNDGQSILDISTERIAFTIPINDFKFEKKLMQQHFNENYLESDKYPTSTFTGRISGISHASGKQELTAEGELTIHGQTREISVKGHGTITDEKIMLEASFPVELVDFNIKIPKVVFYNIAEVVDVTIKFEYSPYEPN